MRELPERDKGIGSLYGAKPLTDSPDAPSPVDWWAIASTGSANDVRVLDYSTGYTGNPSVGSTRATRVFPQGMTVREPHIENLSYTADIEIGFRADLAYGDAGTGGVIRIPARYFWTRYGLFPIGQVDSSGNLKVTLAALLAGEDLTNGLLTAMPKEILTVVHAPAVNVMATATIAAGGAGVRHVCWGLSFTLDSNAAPAVIHLDCLLRDGASGVGTVLWQGGISVTAVAGVNPPPLILPGDLNIPGSANTAMTAEFSAAGGAGTFERVTLLYYNKS